MSLGARRIAAPSLAVLAVVALLGALITDYVSHAVLDSDQFAERATAALEDESVSSEIGRGVADSLIEVDPDLIAVRPVIEGVVGSVVRGSAFQALFEAAVRDLHRAVFEQDQNTLTLTLADIGATVRGALTALNPKLAKQVPAGANAALDAQPPEALLEAAQIVDDFRPMPWILLALGIGLAVAALWIAVDRRGATVVIGVAIGIGAVLALVGVRALRALVLEAVDHGQVRDATATIWDAYLGDLRTALLLFAACGAVIAAAGSSLLRPVDVGAPLKRAWTFLATVPESRRARAIRALALLVAGVLIVAAHEAFLSLLAILIGLYVAYAGVAELMRLMIAEPAGAEADVGPGRTTLLAAALVAIAILGAGAIFIGVGGTSEKPAPIETEGCNGSEALCDRPLDEVALPATHNAMSAATNPGWLFAQQEAGFAEQLRDGIRGLLIDAHYGTQTKDGTVKTDLSDLDSSERQAYADELGTEALDAALRIRDRIVGSETVGERKVYLCHRFCELGAIPIDKALGDFRDFLAANPDEVLVIDIEDYVEPADIAAAVEQSGLIDYVYAAPVGSQWPTLEEMITSGGPVLMLAENDAGSGSIPWYHEAYEKLVQETPYSFKTPDELTDPKTLDRTCKPNRGPADAPLFLINHWIDTSPAPKPSNAAKVNAREPLLARMQRCEELRGLSANLIAVDFYRQGDLFEVVAELNRAAE